MEDLFPALFVIIAIVGSIASSVKKEKGKRIAEEHRKAAVTARVQAAQQKIAQAAAVNAQPAPVLTPARSMQPQVHAHIQPDCFTHDMPGSLGVTSMEGKDPCHEDQLTLERTFAERPEPTSNLSFDWTGDSMVKAVVMQEVLTRPASRVPTCQRRAR